jgi:hypothetical protein
MKMILEKWLFILTGVTLLFLSACQTDTPACPSATGTPRFLTVPPEALPTPMPDSVPAPASMEIGGRTIIVDKVVEGPLCNDTWSGIVYVTCNVQVYPWEDQPTFLKNCDLFIAPGTVVYVAAHNDAAYYNGCSCHTGEITGP